MARRRSAMVRSYADEVKLFRTPHMKVAMAALLLLYLALPVLADGELLYTVLPFLQDANFLIPLLNFAGIVAIGAIGLNLLTGYTGQVSLGHAFFLGAGAYTAAYLGTQHELSMLVWLPVAALIAAGVGAVIGPFALRLRGNYLVIITLGLVFIGTHLWFNWESVTGGTRGTRVSGELTAGPIDFANLEVLGREFTFDQGFFYLVWFLVGVTALVAKNIVRGRPGRAMQAVRDRDVAAEVIGVSLARYKVAAFAISSGMAGLAGALQGSYVGFSSPETWNLLLSIQYIAVIIVGGVGTIFGGILGAVVLTAVPRFIEQYSDRLPFVIEGVGGEGVITIADLNVLIYGVLIVLFLVLEPHGLAAAWLRLKAYFKTWPFSY